MRYSPYKIIASVLGGLGMFGALRVLQDAWLGRMPSLMMVIAVSFVSATLIGAAWILLEIENAPYEDD